MFFLWIAFFLSGMAGISYQLTWVRYLTQLFGASTPAVSATISIFFTGLALGSALGGRFFDKSRRPFISYAILEFLIGIIAAAVPFLFFLAEKFILTRHPSQGAEHPLLLLAMSTIVLLVPTTLLGATFPAMAAVVKKLNNPTYSTGFFYGFNTLGAVMGSLIVSFWLLPAWGQRDTTWIMCSVNIIVGFIFIIAHAWRKKIAFPVDLQEVAPATEKAEEAPQSSDEAPEKRSDQVISHPLAMFLAGVSGFLAIGIEVLWTRSLALSFPASVYVFALVLAAYLVGIGLGSIWIGSASRRRVLTRKTLWGLYFFIGFGSVFTLWMFAHLTPWSFYLLGKGWVGNWETYVGWVGGSALVAMLPATLAMGAAFPLLIGLTTSNVSESGRIAGRVYAVNTMGGVFGSLFVTFFLMPTIGLTESLILFALGYIAMALMTAWTPAIRPAVKWVTCSTIVLGSVLLFTGGHPDANPLKQRASHKLLYYKDTPSATIAIDQNKKGVRTLRVNNYYGLSNTHKATVKMQYHLGHIPMLLHPKPRRSLMIGFATGTTLAAIARHRAKKVDCVELHHEILNLARYFADVNHEVWKNKKKVRLISDDGRRFLLRGGKKYDVIVGDLYLPRNPGVGHLYSIEHFRAVSRRLTKDGIFVAWLPLFQLAPENIASILRSFLKAFPYAEGWVAHWNPKRAILGLVGRPAGKPISAPSHFEERLQHWVNASVKASRMKSFNPSPTQIMKSFKPSAKASPKIPSRRLLSYENLITWANSAPINRLELPVIEFSAPRAMMQAKLTRIPLYLQNINKIKRIRSLEGTPWSYFQRPLASLKVPPPSPRFNH